MVWPNRCIKNHFVFNISYIYNQGFILQLTQPITQDKIDSGWHPLYLSCNAKLFSYLFLKNYQSVRWTRLSSNLKIRKLKVNEFCRVNEVRIKRKPSIAFHLRNWFIIRVLRKLSVMFVLIFHLEAFPLICQNPKNKRRREILDPNKSLETSIIEERSLLFFSLPRIMKPPLKNPFIIETVRWEVLNQVSSLKHLWKVEVL